MRKIFVMLLVAAALVLSGCGAETTEEPTPSENTPSTIEMTTEAEEEQEVPEVQEQPEEPEEVEETEELTEALETAEAEDKDEEGPERTEDGKLIVDLIFFAGQSNMAGAGGNARYAPTVPEGYGYEFRAISDPTRLYPIQEPFGINENNLNAIMDPPGAKKGSLVSAFIDRYYEETGTPVIAVSASAGATDTKFWMSDAVVDDFTERYKRAVVWLEGNDYYVRNKYVVWLQGESDAITNGDKEQYKENMDNIIRPMFINGVEKVFFITPGRTITRKNYFNEQINAQIELGKESAYYSVATTILSAVSTEYMVDEWHYNQTVLNLVGSESAKAVAFYTINRKETPVYDYYHQTTIVPEYYGYSGDEEVEPVNPEDFDIRKKLD